LKLRNERSAELDGTASSQFIVVPLIERPQSGEFGGSL